MARPDPNLAVPPIPAPAADFDSLILVANALTEGVESLSGQRGPPSARAVTFDDLIALGLVDSLTVQGLRVRNVHDVIAALRARIEKLEKASGVAD